MVSSLPMIETIVQPEIQNAGSAANVDGSESPSDVLLGGLQIEKSLKKHPNQWNVTLCMDGTPVNLHIDKGALR